MKRLLFASDYDGTLFQNQTISQSDLKMIKYWQSMGHLFGVVSGRNAESLYLENLKYGLNLDFYISNNGALIEETAFNPLFRESLSPKLIMPIMELLIDYNHLYDCLYTIGVNDGYNFGRYFFDDNPPFNPFDKTSYELFINNPCTMFLEVKNTNYSLEIIKLLESKFPALSIYDHLDFIDIYNKPIDKALAIKKYASYKEIDLNNCFVAGDHVNDISMLKQFNSYSITNGHHSIHQFSKFKMNNIAEILRHILKKV